MGSGNASEAAAGKAVISRRRTSQNMMMDDFMTTKNPRMARIVKSLHSKSLSLFSAGAYSFLRMTLSHNATLPLTYTERKAQKRMALRKCYVGESCLQFWDVPDMCKMAEEGS